MRKTVLKRVCCLMMCAAIIMSLSACASGLNQKSKQKKEILKLYLYGDMSEMNDKKDVRSIMAIFQNEGESVNCYATIKVQGTSSLSYEKKNYTIRFFEDYAHEVEKPVDIGWGAQHEYCLKANWIDKTHSRNIVTANLAAEIQKKYGVLEQAPNNGLIDGFPVEVYVNGQYHGLYTWNIPKGAWQFGMDEDDPNHIVMCGETWDSATVFKAEPDFEAWSVEAGPETEESLLKFIRMADFVMHSSDEEFKAHFGEYIDLDATLNYYVLAEFAYLLDNFGKNMLIVTYDGKVWYPSLYDLDTSWGTDYTGLELWDYENELPNFARMNDLAERVQLLFPQELHDRYFELREDILTKEHILEMFHEFDRSIPAAAKERENGRWGKNIPGYGLDQIEEYLDTVMERLDEKYENLVS